MSDDVQFSGGGVVAVDTETLRRTAAQFVAAREELDALCHRVGSLEMMLFAARAHAWDAAGEQRQLRVDSAFSPSPGARWARGVRDGQRFHDESRGI